VRFFRLYAEGLEAFAAAAFEEGCFIPDDSSINCHRFHSSHECRNKLFDHLLHSMEQVGYLLV
jgi:hypothetical protein